MKFRIIISLLLINTTIVFGSNNQLYPVIIKGKYGYTNKAGELKIKAIYDYAENFYENRAVVALNNMPCVIDLNNKRIIDTGVYSQIQRYSEGRCKVVNFTNEQFFIDTLGKVLFKVDPQYYDARRFKNGLSNVSKQVDVHTLKFNHDIVNLGYKFGFINEKGEEVIPLIYDDADDFENGFCRVRLGTKFGIINTKGEEVVPVKYYNIGKFLEDFAVFDNGGKYGYLNTKGEVIIAPAYKYAYDFSEQLAGVMVDGKFGFINTSGALVIQAKYEAVRPFSEGLAAVKLNGKWGFIDKQGTPKIGFVFDDATLFADGRCAVLVKRKWGFISSDGRTAIPFEFDAVGTFNDGIAEVMIGQISVYMTKSGMIIPDLKK